MKPRLNQPKNASWLAEKLNLKLIGNDFAIECISPLNQLKINALTFATKVTATQCSFQALVIGAAEMAANGFSVLESVRPRLDFAKALQLLHKEVGFESYTAEAIIHPSVRMGSNVVIGKGVEIGANTQIYSNVVISDGVKIGCDCMIKSCAVIGEEGFGLERDEDGTPIRILHFGSVKIGDRVEIGSLTTVCRGTMGETVIEDDAKIDDHVHIAHNCLIRKKVMVTATASISGSVEIKERAWIAPNSTILQKKVVGADAMVGIGAVVMTEVQPNTCVVGNPARKFQVGSKSSSDTP